MKKFFTLSAMALAAASMAVAAPSINASKARLSNAQISEMKQHKTEAAVAAPAKAKKQLQTVTLNNKTVRNLNTVRGARLDKSQTVAAPVMDKVLNIAAEASNAPAATAEALNAYYKSEGMLKFGVFYNAEYGGFVSYNTPYMISQAFHGGYEKVAGDSWTIGAENPSDASEYLDEEGNFSKLLFGQDGGNVGGYYTPVLTSKTGESYYYGSLGEDAGTKYTYSVNFQASDAEANPAGVYTVYDVDDFYTGFSNTYAFGSRSFENSKGSLIEADQLLIELGDLGNGTEFHGVSFRGLSKYEDPFQNCSEEEAYIGMTIIDHAPNAEGADENGNLYYYGYIDATSIEALGAIPTDDYAFKVEASFSEEIDGFTNEIVPVTQGEVSVLFYNFRKANMGIYMTYSANTTEFEPHSYYDQWVDGETDGYFYCASSYTLEAVLNFDVLFNYIGDAEGNQYFEIAAPTTCADGEESILLVSTVEEGKEYNDFDLVATFQDPENEWGMDCDNEEMLAGVSYSTEYLEDYGVIPFYVAVKPLPEGVTGREMTLTVHSGTPEEGSNKVVWHVTQGEVSTGIDTIAAPAAKKGSYNMMGQKVTNTEANGLYIINGKKVMK